RAERGSTARASDARVNARPRAAAMKQRRSGRFTERRERIADAVALHATPERHARDAERGGGALPVPAVRLEHAQEPRALVGPEAPATGRVALERLREVDARRVRHREHGLERVLELADIAGPRVLEKRPARVRARRDERRPVTLVEALHEMRDERRQVLAPL